MNRIFEKIIDIESDIYDLLRDIQTGVEHCSNNKTDIENRLGDALSHISRIYRLNKSNFKDYAPATKQAVEQTTEVEEPLKSKLELYDKIEVPFSGSYPIGDDIDFGTSME